MNQQFNEDLVAELLAMNQVLHHVLHGLASISGDRRLYLSTVLEAGLDNIGTTDLYSVPRDRVDAVRENARARFSDIVGSVKP